MRWTLPNILTILRLLAAPGVAVMFLYFQRPWADWFALVLFVLAAITDFLDGYLARAWKQESRFGAMLDPIADKAMVVIALVIIVGLSTADKLVMDPWILLPATVEASGLPTTWEASVVHTKVGGDATYIDEWVDVSFSLGTIGSKNNVTWDSVRVGITYTRASRGVEGININFGYEF